jgi:hypothetical protein
MFKKWYSAVNNYVLELEQFQCGLTSAPSQAAALSEGTSARHAPAFPALCAPTLLGLLLRYL